LRTLRKPLEKRKLVCARCARANVRSEKGDRRLARENKDKLTDLAAAGASKQIRLNQKADNYTKKKADHLVCFLFAIIAHYEKRRKNALCTLNLPT